jgi:hypothetical protein
LAFGFEKYFDKRLSQNSALSQREPAANFYKTTYQK